MADINVDILTRPFLAMGARVLIEKNPPLLFRPARRPIRFLTSVRQGDRSQFTIDLATDKKGQYFLLRYDADRDIRMQVVDSQPDDRHLLLLVQNGSEKGKFLCGHDEREWFTCAVPGNGVRDIKTAKEALKPKEVLEAQKREGVKEKDKGKRATEGYKRQGEWFLLEVADKEVEGLPILKNEPLRRGRGRPHMAQECVRKDGVTVYVNGEHPNGISQEEFNALVAADRDAARRGMWRVMVRDAKVYVRGNFSQPGGHKTLFLREWHRVFPNTEEKAPWSRAVAFLD